MTKLSRRTFLKLGATGIAAAVLAGCRNPRRWVVLEPYVRPPEEQLAGVATWYATTCRQCPAGCGIVVRVMNGRALKIEGNPEHPLNRGKLCARGQAGLQLLYNPDRLPGPLRQRERGSRQFQPISWDDGLNSLYDNLQQAEDRVAIWLGSTASGHLLDICSIFATAIGAPAPIVYDLYSEIDGVGALTAASQQIFGESAVPAYDVATADVVISFGADFLGTWLSPVHYGAAFGAFRSQPLGKRGYLVQLEPRMSITGAKADRWLPIGQGSEGLVAQALARIIADEGLGSAERTARATAVAREVNIDQVTTQSGLSVPQLESLAQIFANAERPLAIPGNTIAAQADGTTAVAAVQLLNVIAGNIGQAGGLSLSPNPPLSSLARPVASGFTDVEALLESMRSGAVQALLIAGSNPAYALPNGADFVGALENVPFVVSFSPLVDETAAQADLVLPDRTYLESWGYVVPSPSFDMPIVGSQQPVVTPVFDSRSTADLLLTVAKGLTAASAALPWNDEVAFLQDTIARLPSGAAGGSGADALWARFLQHGGWWPAAASPAASPMPTPAQPIQVTPPTFRGNPEEYPYLLHLYLSDLLSDGRGANQPWLQGSPDPMTTIAWQTWVDIHPETAQSLGVGDGDIVRVTSLAGEIEVPVSTYPAIRPDTVAIALGQGHSEDGRYARNRGANPIQLVDIATVGDNSFLSWASMRVKIAPTGRQMSLAEFQSKRGVTEGLVNEDFPG